MKLPNDLDEGIRNLVVAMNKWPGIETVSSCSGHEDKQGGVFFLVEDIECLPLLLYWFDACHSGEKWSVEVYTDCVADGATFHAMPTWRGDATASANIVARCLEGGLED